MNKKMTRFEQKNGLTRGQSGIYISILGLLLSIFGSILFYMKNDAIWKTDMAFKVNLLIIDKNQQKDYNKVFIGKLDTINSKVSSQDVQIKFLKTTKQNKKVLTPDEYQDLSINLNK